MKLPVGMNDRVKNLPADQATPSKESHLAGIILNILKLLNDHLPGTSRAIHFFSSSLINPTVSVVIYSKEQILYHFLKS